MDLGVNGVTMRVRHNTLDSSAGYCTEAASILTPACVQRKFYAARLLLSQQTLLGGGTLLAGLA